ncbi:shoot gravitropism 2 (SGR2) [Artemisia annua]|uniref:Shoot gravitropism 2 (SGR2) n=1 Tax=Artemisia annua TaxID=35608 RepID=A0A2U1LUR4_ARTAN|nr:shoot gravitropism 2 (SGR2) [Artemisia annua]
MSMRLKEGVDDWSIDDLFNNLRVFEQDIKGSSKPSSSEANVAFVGQGKTSNNKVSSGSFNSGSYACSSNNIKERDIPAGFADEVDLLRRHSFPVYWNGDNRRVLRGNCFARKGSLNWFPLREDVAEQLEFAYRSRVWHCRIFQPSGLFVARVDMQGSTPDPGLHAIFTGEDDTWDAWLKIRL